MQLTEEKILEWLHDVKDPEIPVLSLVDLGIITDININAESVHIEMTPTFVGCPALDMMKNDVIARLTKAGVNHVDVEVNFKKAWTSERISENGRKALKKFGLAPPPAGKVLLEDLDILEHVACPRCDGTNTQLKNPFGPTLCRSIHYCLDCKEAFEQFKPV